MIFLWRKKQNQTDDSVDEMDYGYLPGSYEEKNRQDTLQAILDNLDEIREMVIKMKEGK